MSSIFTKYSELDPALMLRQIDDAIAGNVFDSFSYLDPDRVRRQLHSNGVDVSNAAMLDPARFEREVDAELAGGGYIGPLDIVAGAVVAFGSRALSSATRGQPVYTIREDSGDTTQSFSSDASTGAVSAAAITAYLDGAGGFVAGWRDQSGGTSHVLQSTSANQPRWLANQFGSVPGVSFVKASEQRLSTIGNVTIPNGEYTVFVVQIAEQMTAGDQSVAVGVNYDNFSSNNDPDIGVTNTSGGGGFGMSVTVDVSTDNEQTNNGGGTSDYIPSGFASTAVVFDATWTGAFNSTTMSVNGDVKAIANDFGYDVTIGDIVGRLSVGAGDTSPGANRCYQGVLAEIILYPTVLSDLDRAAVRQNMAAAYGIVLP